VPFLVHTEIDAPTPSHTVDSTGYRPIADAVRALSSDESDGQRPNIVDRTSALLDAEAMQRKHSDNALHLRGSRAEWFAPRSLSQLLTLKDRYGAQARIVAGNTEIGVEQRFKVRLSLFVCVCND
jgi:xanthine dehydrogenase iron-sulfur cluster and FAD-binding subunit A